MKCPECERLGERSKLYMPDSYMSTAMGGSQNYYDEDGDHHYHEVNHSSGQGHCSNGHVLNVTRSTKCKSCDYGTPQTITLAFTRTAEPEPEYIEFKNLLISIPREPGGGIA